MFKAGIEKSENITILKTNLMNNRDSIKSFSSVMGCFQWEFVFPLKTCNLPPINLNEYTLLNTSPYYQPWY